MARIAGTVHVTADGKTLDISGAVSVPLGNSAKTPIVSKNGNVHYAEEPIAPFVEGANFESDGATVNIKFTGTEGRWL